jgi:hypothetical protein
MDEILAQAHAKPGELVEVTAAGTSLAIVSHPPRPPAKERRARTKPTISAGPKGPSLLRRQCDALIEANERANRQAPANRRLTTNPAKLRKSLRRLERGASTPVDANVTPDLP